MLETIELKKPFFALGFASAWPGLGDSVLELPPYPNSEANMLGRRFSFLRNQGRYGYDNHACIGGRETKMPRLWTNGSRRKRVDMHRNVKHHAIKVRSVPTKAIIAKLVLLRRTLGTVQLCPSQWGFTPGWGGPICHHGPHRFLNIAGRVAKTMNFIFKFCLPFHGK